MGKNVVLAAVDLQHEASDKHIADEALALAHSHGADLHLVFVIPDEKVGYVQSYVPAEMKAAVEKEVKGDLAAFATALEDGEINITTHILRGIIYEEIVNLSDNIRADIVVVGAHKPGFMDFFLGPNATRVARHAECSVMIVRPERNG